MVTILITLHMLHVHRHIRCSSPHLHGMHDVLEMDHLVQNMEAMGYASVSRFQTRNMQALQLEFSKFYCHWEQNKGRKIPDFVLAKDNLTE